MGQFPISYVKISNSQICDIPDFNVTIIPVLSQTNDLFICSSLETFDDSSVNIVSWEQHYRIKWNYLVIRADSLQRADCWYSQLSIMTRFMHINTDVVILMLIRTYLMYKSVTQFVNECMLWCRSKYKRICRSNWIL